MQIWECRSSSELWNDAERVPASWAFGTDGALLWGVLLLLPLRGALNLWHCLRRICLFQGTLPYFLPVFQYFHNNSSYLMSWCLLFLLRISSQDTRLCVQISWRTIMTGWVFSRKIWSWIERMLILYLTYFKNVCQVFTEYEKLLHSDNYVTKRQSLKVKAPPIPCLIKISSTWIWATDSSATGVLTMLEFNKVFI